MSTVVSDHLTTALLDFLSTEHAIDRAARAIVICTVDEHGWPHPAMLSSLELVARDAQNIRLTTHVDSRTTRHLTRDGKVTVIVADEGGVFYIKGNALLLPATVPTAPDQVLFNMRIESVLEDNPAAHEEARVTSGIRVERGALDMARAKAILGELTADAGRPVTDD